MAFFPKLKQGLLNFFKPKSQGSFAEVEKKKQERIAQGLPVSVRKDRYEPTMGGGLLRGALALPVRALSNLAQAGDVLTGNKEHLKNLESGNIGSKYLGKQYAIGQGINKTTGEKFDMFSDPMRSFKDSVGAGLEAASYIPIARAAKITGAGLQAGAKGLLARTAQKAVPLAKEGLISGALQGAGTSMQQDESFKNIAKETVKQGLLGAVAAPILGTALHGAGSVAKGGVDLYQSMTPAQRQAGFVSIGNNEKPIKVYRGEKGSGVAEKDFTPKKTLVVDTDQQELIRKMAQEGNQEAKELVNKYGERKIDYNLIDPIIQKNYSGKFDSIKYENKHLPKKGYEFNDLNEPDKFYSEKPEVAEMYSLQNRSAKYAPLIDGQSSTIGTTRSQNRASKKSSDYTMRQSTFDPISEEDSAKIIERIKDRELKKQIEYQKTQGDKAVSDAFPGGRVGFQNKKLEKSRNQNIDKAIEASKKIMEMDRQIKDLKVQNRNYIRAKKEIPVLEEIIATGKTSDGKTLSKEDMQFMSRELQKNKSTVAKIDSVSKEVKTPILAKENQVPKIRKMTRSREIASLEKLASEQSGMTKGTPRQETSQQRMSEGEARSIEIQSNQARDILSGEPVAGDVSLPIIIKNTITPVKHKVHIIDTYLTTPQYVMNKIGFGKEATMLRDASDALWKELPKNLERVTEWSKAVPEASNKRIFRYLDGEALDLTTAEAKVAGEIKEWFKEWAVRLKLPKENTITHYITHIFDKELMGKEFDEDLAKIIADRIPGSVYDPFLLKRLGAKGYKQDTWEALDAYIKRATRKVHIDPVLEAIQSKTGSSLDVSPLEKSVFNYIKKYVDNINMRPSEAEEGVDNFVKSMIGYKLGQRPVVGILKFLRQATFRGMLGLNPASALRNLSQGVNTYATLGEKYTVLGYAGLFKKGAGEELKREGVLNAGFIQDRALSATKKAMEKVDKVLFSFFDTAEHINRGAAYFGAKAQAMSRGMTEEAAIKYAKTVVRKTQFVFDTVDTPVGMSGDLMKTLFQFQTYTTKQMEFLVHMAKDKNFAGLLRYALGGTAFVYTVGQLFGMEPKEILPMYRFDTPPSLKAPVEVAKALLDTPDKFGNPRTAGEKLGDIGKASVGLIPAGSQAKKTIEGIKSVKEGGSFDKSGKLQFEQGQSTAEKAQSIIFGKYASNEAKDYFKNNETQAKLDAPIEKLYKQVIKLRDEGKLDEANALTQALSKEEYETYKKIRSREQAKETLEAEKKMIPTVQKLLKLKEEGRIDEANAITQAMTPEDFKIYKLARDKLKEKPEFNDGETVDERPLIVQILTYARAIGVDPVTAFNRIFTGQHIKKVYNGTIVVTRLSMEKSQKIKESRGAKSSDFKLDHTIPLILGGSNSEDNLKIVSTADWESYTPVEKYLWGQIDSGKMKKKRAQQLIKDFKNGIISFEQIKNL